MIDPEQVIGGTYSVSMEDSETPRVVFEFTGFMSPTEALAFIEVMQNNISSWFDEPNVVH